MRNKQKIVNIVGKSGSGKTSLAKELEKLGHNIIKSYTTREKREKDEWGHTFIDEEVQVVNLHNLYDDTYSKWVKVIEENGNYEYKKPIALKEIYNDYYWAMEEQYQGQEISIYVVCPDGASQVKENVKDAEVITIYLQCDEYLRMIRMNEDKTRSPQSISDRLKKDREVFKVCECDFVVDGNRELEKVLKDVIDIIER